MAPSNTGCTLYGSRLRGNTGFLIFIRQFTLSANDGESPVFLFPSLISKGPDTRLKINDRQATNLMRASLAGAPNTMSKPLTKTFLAFISFALFTSDA
jgi:hypothetical protein